MDAASESRFTMLGGRWVEICLAGLAAALALAVSTSPQAFAVVVLVLVLATALSQIELFVNIVIFLIPLNPLLPVQLPVRDVSTVLHLFLFFIVAGLRIKSGKPLSTWLFGGKLNKVIVLFAITAAFSQFILNGSNTTSQRAIFRLFSYISLYFGITGWIETKEQILRIIKTLLASLVCVALFGIYQALIGGYSDFYYRIYPTQEEGLEPWVGRVTSFLFHFNSLAGYLNLVIPLGIACHALQKGILRRLGCIGWVLGSVTLFLTQSRGGIMGWIGIVGIAAFCIPQSARTRFKATVAIAVAGACLLPIVTTNFQRLEDLDESQKLERLSMWAAAGTMFLSKPVFGVGYGNFRNLYVNYTTETEGGLLDAHNMYLQFLAETGLVGFFLFMTLIVLASRIAVKGLRSESRWQRTIGFWGAGALIATMVHGFVDYLFAVSPQFGAMFWLTLASLNANLFLSLQPQLQGNE